MRVVDTRTPALLSALPRRLQPPNPIDMTEIDMSKQYYSDRTHGIDGTVKATLKPTEIEVESSPGRYSIAEGELALDYSARHRLADCPEAAAAPAAGVVTGRFEPAIFPGREQFRADSILFERHDASSQRLIATQTYNGQTQGILVVIEQDEPHACARAFLIVNSVLRLAQATLAEVNWDKQARTLDARLVLESSYAGKPCTLKDGCISFAY